MKKLISLFPMLLLFSGCLTLDDNLFNNKKITEYRLKNYSGEVDFKLDASFDIDDSFVHLFTLNSRGPNENNSTSIYAVYIGDISRIGVDTVIMYCHGNRDHMDFYWPRAQLLANTGGKNRYGVMMIDYRGFGMSDGHPDEEGLFADVDAALNWLKSKGLQNERLIIYGFSLGCAPATKMCAHSYSLIPSKILLEAPFASPEVMIQDGTGLALPGAFFTSFTLNNAEEIKSVNQPFFWIHGEADDFLDVDTHGQVVYDHYIGLYKEAHRIPGAGHSTIQKTIGIQNYLNSVGDFILK
ncbi:MAG: alpha/beta fold hydrolase [Bacteroidetes bacterium]|nr:alpha/beta fold hydrolase [Bacteroidota bacterium]